MVLMNVRLSVTTMIFFFKNALVSYIQQIRLYSFEVNASNSSTFIPEAFDLNDRYFRTAKVLSGVSRGCFGC